MRRVRSKSSISRQITPGNQITKSFDTEQFMAGHHARNGRLILTYAIKRPPLFHSGEAAKIATSNEGRRFEYIVLLDNLYGICLFQ
jgi:hypothetical protein